jgi:ankyrin repeat protein
LLTSAPAAISRNIAFSFGFLAALKIGVRPPPSSYTLRRFQNDDSTNMNNNAQIFIKSVEQNNVSSIAALLGTGCFDVNAPLGLAELQTPLWHAAASGRGEIVALLLDAGAHIDAQSDASRDTPCHAAARRDHADVVALLVARAADVALRNYANDTPIDIAIENRNEAIVLTLLDVDSAALAASSLCLAATVSTNVIQHLLRRRVDLCALRDDTGRTPLHRAVWRSSDDAVLDMLLGVVGIDVDARDTSGCTCAHTAAMMRESVALARFIAAGADVDAADGAAETPLHHSAYDASGRSTALLLAAGANVHARCRAGRTPAHAAARNNAALALHALLAFGADCDAPDNEGVTPRQLAAAHRGCTLPPAAAELECARRRVVAQQLAFVRGRALEICLALHALELDALRLIEILQHACGPAAPHLPFHVWWRIVTTVKHHR